jgi:hypothetical protein
VLIETPIKKKDLPTECVYTVEQILDNNFPDGLETEFD